MRIERTGPVRKLTPRVARFLVEALGGVSLDDVQSPERERIDFACLRGLLAVEVKTLEGTPVERMNNFTNLLRDRPDFPVFYGSVPLEAVLQNLDDSDRLRTNALDRLGRTIVSHLKKANAQLGRHAADYPRPNCASIVVLINEDHSEYDPKAVGSIVQRELARSDDRGPRHRSIDGVLYFSERHGSVVDGLVAFPIVAIHGPNIGVQSWKADLLDHLMQRWAEWNGSALSMMHHDELGSFEAFDHVPEKMPRHERWRLDYRRRPYLKPLSTDALRDRFDEVMSVITLWGIRESPIELDMNAAKIAMEQFAHVRVEMHDRALPADVFELSPLRLAAAAMRLGFSEKVIGWLQALEKNPGGPK